LYGQYNVNTLDAGIDDYIEKPILAAKDDIIKHLGVDEQDIRITDMGYDYYPYYYYPTLEASVKGLKIQYRYTLNYAYNPDGSYNVEASLALKSVINESGIDLYAKAAEQLKEQFNPETFKLDDWKLDENDLAKFKFSVDNDAKIEIKVDMRSGIIKEAVYSEEYIDSEGNLVKFDAAYKYDEGILREEKYHAQTLKDGRLLEECESDVKYDAYGNITEGYELTSSYGDDGKLTQKSAVIGTFQDGFFRMYAVAYDVDTAGNVTYTHVYDEAGNEISGGDGFIHPSDILNTISPGTAEIRQNAEAPVVDADNNRFSEIVARMAVQDEVLKQAKDHRFVNEIAKKAGAAEQPQP